MNTKKHIYFLLFSIAVFLFIAGCANKEQGEAALELNDISLEAYQAELLDIAFESVSAMPAFPHIKNRSRAQEAVVQVCLELEQPKRALGYIEQIENWNQQLSYAELAFYCAENNYSKKDIEHFLDMAKQIPEDIQDWQRDRIKVNIAQTYAYIGNREKSDEYEKGIEISESGKVARIHAMNSSSETFDKQIESIDALIATEEFDIVKNAVIAYIELYKCNYEDINRREIVEEKIKASYANFPINIKIELLMELADSCLSHENTTEALRFVNEAKSIMNSASWQSRFVIPIMAQLAKLSYLSGEKETALSELQKAIDLYQENLDKIVDIYKAGVLRPIAEASVVMDDKNFTLDIYKKAIEAGVENPNSRPRAEDLSATCCSMAQNRFEPDQELLNRIKEIQGNLGDPW